MFPFWPSVYGAVIGGPNIIMVLALGLLVGGLPVVTALHVRWPAHLRSRTDVRRWLVRTVVSAVIATMAVVAVAMVVWGVYVFGWLAHSSPDLVDPEGYGSAGDLDEILAQRYPLWSLSGGNAVAFVGVSAAWAAVHAGLAAAIAVVCALLIRQHIAALLAMPVIVIGLGVVAELTVGPQFSSIQNWMHPGGLLQSSASLALVPSVLLALVTGVLFWWICRRSPTAARFS